MKSDLKKLLKVRAHALKPVVLTGQHGITPGVLAEINIALDHHELIKVRVNAADREERAAMVDEIVQATEAELIQAVGHVVTVYRQKPETPPATVPNRAPGRRKPPRRRP